MSKKILKTYKGHLLVTFDDSYQYPVGIGLKHCSMIDLKKEEAEWLYQMLGEFLKPDNLPQEAKTSNPPPDQL